MCNIFMYLSETLRKHWRLKVEETALYQLQKKQKRIPTLRKSASFNGMVERISGFSIERECMHFIAYLVKRTSLVVIKVFAMSKGI